MHPRRHPFQTTSTKASRANLITRGNPSTVVWRTPPLDIFANHAGYPNTQLAGLALVTHRNQESNIRCNRNPTHTLQTASAKTPRPHTHTHTHTPQKNPKTRNTLPRLGGKQPVQQRNAPPTPTRPEKTRLSPVALSWERASPVASGASVSGRLLGPSWGRSWGFLGPSLGLSLGLSGSKCAGHRFRCLLAWVFRRFRGVCVCVWL